VVKDIQGLLPGVASRVEVTGGVVGVAEVGENSSLAVAVAEFLPQGHGLLVVGDGLLVMAEEMVGVADAVQGECFPPPVAEVLLQGEGLLAVGKGLLGIS
jgi:hypothetical protein